jgi:hypothetical protein
VTGPSLTSETSIMAPNSPSCILSSTYICRSRCRNSWYVSRACVQTICCGSPLQHGHALARPSTNANTNANCMKGAHPIAAISQDVLH